MGLDSRLSTRLVVLAVLALAVTLFGVAVARTAVAAESTGMWLEAQTPVTSGDSMWVSGGLTITTALPGATVSIYKREVGESADTLVTDAPLSVLPWGSTFSATIPAVARTCVVTAVWNGSADYPPTSYWLCAAVRPTVRLTAPRVSHKVTRLVARVDPLQPMDAPAFVAIKTPIMLIQRRIDGHWRSFGLGDVWSTDGESWSSSKYFGLKPGTYVLRARFVGSNYNDAAASHILRITIN